MNDGSSKSFLRNVSRDLRMYSGVIPADSQNCDDNCSAEMSTIAANPIRLALDLLVPLALVLMERSTDRSALAAFAFSFCSGDSIVSFG